MEFEQANGHTWSGFLCGLGLGLAAGILFAPYAGSETRRILRTRSREATDAVAHKAGSLAGAARETVGKQAERVQSAIDDVTHRVQSSVQAGKEAYRAGKEAYRTSGAPAATL